MILLANDDGIYSPNLWELARKLKTVSEVGIVAPTSQMSAVGTHLTLRAPIHVSEFPDQIKQSIPCYAVDGTPGDCIVVGDEHLFPNSVEMVVSGINDGINLGDDIVFSGTVAAALMGYLRDLPSIAFSMPYRSPKYLPYATDFAALICKDVLEGKTPRDILLNINYPERIPSEVKGIRMVKPGHKSHVESAQKGFDGRDDYYWLKYKVKDKFQKDTDIDYYEQGYITIVMVNRMLFSAGCEKLEQDYLDDLFERFQNI
jgi:5'-nucleotidase